MATETSVSVNRSPKIQAYRLGQEKAPLLVVDSFVDHPDHLVSLARDLDFKPPRMAYPGVRAVAPTSYQEALLSFVGAMVEPYFGIRPRGLKLSMCHYSLVTTAPEELSVVQRVPHVDSFSSEELATVHYLFHGNHGGTSFYRHRETGYEVVNEDRRSHYFGALQREVSGARQPPAAYINGDTELFQRIASMEGVFNRLLVYRRNSLHSGNIEEQFVPDPSPDTGRLSINGFIDPVF
ncbi:DUF6445 family protein [Marinimicrobium agarilyticum]|uniref:DUF6445 family protein n=1 Tax=Marinimicrobium agarilyticum TaxID=306546 RepID=UPI000567E82D|nr:DUF6445 family protein [Marinimicrobium agarilyticum]